jgi:hypothetical protein
VIRFIAALLIIAAVVVVGGLVFFRSSPPSYQGPFNWTRVVVPAHGTSEGTEYEVFESIKQFKKLFSLEPGDECFYLTGEEWTWRDTKDVGFSLVPIFCPKKGGGWAVPPHP